MLRLPVLIELSLDVLRDLLLDRDEGGRLVAVAPVARHAPEHFEFGDVITAVAPEKLAEEVCRVCRVRP